MLEVVEDILGGLPVPHVPAEWNDFALMRRMGWSWRDLTGDNGPVPEYVRTFVAHFLQLTDEASQREADRRSKR